MELSGRRAVRRRHALSRQLWCSTVIVALLGLASCALNPSSPGRYTIDDRLANVPVEELQTTAPAEILWNDHQVPFIVAQNDRDAAYLLGIAHAHLRESQMELLRRAARGRLSESAGGLASDLDALVRTLDLDRAVPQMAEMLEPSTREWIQAYVDGVNDFIGARRDRPSERWLINATDTEAWTVEDVLALGRLASVDITWGRLFREARLKKDAKSEAYLERSRRYTDNGQPSFGPDEPTPLAPLFALARTGSNSFAVSGGRTTSGGAMIASDPHLGVLQPNLFCIVGYRTPQGAVAGLTFAGIPFVVIGRNEHIAWGGTNMQALSSVFYDVEGDSAEAFSERTETIQRRWWFDRKVSVCGHRPLVARARA
jgi:penicillin amidase